MNPQELRIGNWINLRGENRIVTSIPLLIGRYNVSTLPNQYSSGSGLLVSDIDEIEPIPLTHDILKKTNMVHSFPYGGNNGYYELNGFYLHYDMEEENDFFVMYERKLIKLNSVHQLQNLYFSLTGEELEIKL